MAGVTPGVMVMILVSIIAQVIGLFLMPMSKGLTNPIPTIGFALSFMVGIGMLARAANSGVNLGLLVPIVAASVPLGAIAIGVLVYGETASIAKIGTLVVACLLIGVANLL